MSVKKIPKKRSARQKNSRVTEEHQYSDFLAPRYLGVWLLIAIIWLVGRIPSRWGPRLAKMITPLALKLAVRRRQITLRNLELCFPERSLSDRQQLLSDTFYANILGLIETARVWTGSITALQNRIEWQGLEHLQAAEAKGKGVILVGAHFSVLDLAGALFSQVCDYDLIYRKHDNPLFNYFMTRCRERWCRQTIARKDMRLVLRSLKAERVLWYAPDQDYGAKASVFVPFFGIPTATITMTSKLAAASGAQVVPVFYYRKASQQHYGVRFYPPLPIPSDDDLADAATINRWLEDCIKEYPEQYLWLHKRFKTRPKGEASVYEQK